MEERLTEEEIKELRDFLRGRRAVAWLYTHSKGLAAWVAAIIGGWYLIHDAVANTIRGVIVWAVGK